MAIATVTIVLLYFLLLILFIFPFPSTQISHVTSLIVMLFEYYHSACFIGARCSRLGLVSLAYLWRRNQAELLQEMIESGVKAVLIKVASMG